VKNPQRLPDPTVRWVQADGRLTREAYQYLRELDEAVRGLIGTPVPLPSFNVSSLPDPSLYIGAEIFVPNETGGPVTAFSDGVNWLRSTDRAVVS
jgi:hypothetical protein